MNAKSPIHNHKLTSPWLATVAFLACAMAGSNAHADAPNFSATISGRAIYDSNVFLQDNAPLAAGQTVPGTPARAHAWVGDAGALLDYKDASRSALTYEISYAPEVVRYDGYSSENHTDSLLSANLKGTQDLWSYGAKASVFYVDGSNDSPVYNRLGGGPAIGAPTVAFRRKHIDTRASAQLTRELTDDFFVRDVVNTLARDYHTHQSAQADYANYISVSETTVGADIGWRVQKDFALLAGVRGGVQTQENILGVNLNYSNTLARFLVGAEGNLRPNLKLTVLAGPDERWFSSAVRPNFSRHHTVPYFDTAATWTASTQDTLTLSAIRYLWVPYVGRCAYFDGLYDASWKHAFDSTWSASAGANFHEGDSGGYNSTARRDWIYTGKLGLSYAFDRQTKLDAGYQHDWSASYRPTPMPGREYHQDLFTLGVAHTF